MEELNKDTSFTVLGLTPPCTREEAKQFRTVQEAWERIEEY